MESKAFCPKCGSTTGPFIKGFCRDCFLKGRDILSVPEKIELAYCQQCGKVKVLGRQVGLENALVRQAIRQKARVKELSNSEISVDFGNLQQGEATATVRAKGFAGSVPLIVEKEVRVSLRPGQCDACMRLKSDYWEAKVQLRGEKEKVQKAFSRLEELLDVMHRKNSLAAIASASENRQGIDALIGSSKAASVAVKKLQREFRASVKTSFKLQGRDKCGREKKRLTFAVRL